VEIESGNQEQKSRAKIESGRTEKGEGVSDNTCEKRQGTHTITHSLVFEERVETVWQCDMQK
jgi:hypothetical protein